MKIQKWLITLTALFSMFTSASLLAQTYDLDPVKSEIEWKGTKVGGGHEGTIKFKSGNLSFKKGKLSSGELVVDMSSIDNADLTDPKKKAKLEEHLSSDDFFAVSEHPTAKIVFTNISPKDGNDYEIKADFTVRGITKPVTFMAEVDEKAEGIEGEAEFSFDRSNHNVKYNSGTFFENLGDKLIHNDIVLDIKVVANK